MKNYIGVKRVSAKEMNLGDYNTHRGCAMPDDEDKSKEGYFVVYPDCYVSWCPKKQFEEANRPIGALTFGDAIEAAKMGLKIARAGWNGKGISVALQVPDGNSKMTGAYLYIDTTGLQTDNAAAPKSLVPWLASQTDMLAEDWCIVE